MAYTTIKKPSSYFNTKLYTGNGTSQSITGVGFQPDLVWMKDRNSATLHNVLVDAVRGTTKAIYSNLTAAEETQPGSLTAFNSDGFSVGNMNDTNANGDNFVGWNWLASNTTASNTDGSITSTVSANTTSGFSIVSYTGTGSAGTVGHGLGVEPACMILKDRTDGTVYWYMYHKSLGNNTELYLNTTNAAPASTGAWNTTSPTSSVFSVGSHGGVNASGDSMIAYCFAEKQGFSKFGSYVGNGNADGTFVYTGFKPAMVILKVTSSAGYTWILYDNKRNTFNVNDKTLQPNQSIAESTLNGNCDFLSNGFKLRTTDGNNNGSGLNIIYMAFAEEPLVGDNPATAR